MATLRDISDRQISPDLSREKIHVQEFFSDAVRRQCLIRNLIAQRVLNKVEEVLHNVSYLDNADESVTSVNPSECLTRLTTTLRRRKPASLRQLSDLKALLRENRKKDHFTTSISLHRFGAHFLESSWSRSFDINRPTQQVAHGTLGLQRSLQGFSHKSAKQSFWHWAVGLGRLRAAAAGGPMAAMSCLQQTILVFSH